MQISIARSPERTGPNPSLMPDDACGLCGYWNCKCGQNAARIVIPSPTVRPLAPTGGPTMRCARCGGWVGVAPLGTAWICNVCASMPPGVARAVRPVAAATDSDPDMDEALRRVRQGR